MNQDSQQGQTEQAEPSIEEMVRLLIARGWRKITSSHWKSPTGKIHLGPYGAWKVMSGAGSSLEFESRTIAGHHAPKAGGR